MRSAWVGLLSFGVLVTACGDDDGSTDSGMSMPDGGGMCAESADCDDGLFCNGEETCDPGSGAAGPNGCVPGAQPCEPILCDEDEDSCDDSCADADNDGVADQACGGSDCDDSDPDRYPGATEICDADDRDEDCDGETFGELDADGDGFVSDACCNGSDCAGDCDDSNANAFPGESETCDEVDNDCDGMVDEGIVRDSYYPDADGDGYGEEGGQAVVACARPEGYADNDSDCDDTSAEVSPVSPELCDERDNNCNGVVDEVTNNTFWEDVDEDGWGDSDRPMAVDSCVPPTGHVATQGDCAPMDPSIHPMADEICDRIDQNCSLTADPGGEDEAEDVDADGHAPTDATCSGGFPVDDCDDDNPYAYPGATEFCSGFDADCDTMVDEAATASCSPDDACDQGCRADDDLSHQWEALCAINSGSVYCWGSESGGRFGEGGIADVPPYAVNAPLERMVSSARQVAVGYYHACAVLEDRTVRCWGENQAGQLGIGNTDIMTGIATADVTDVVQLAMGTLHSLALRSNGEVYQWGLDWDDTPADGRIDATPTPFRVQGLDPALEIVATGRTNCARTAEAEVWCWGWAPLGNGTNADSGDPVHISTLDGALGLRASDGSICARFSDRWDCWGLNYLAIGQPSATTGPATVTQAGTATAWTAGSGRGCAVYDDMSVRCWGTQDDGALATAIDSSASAYRIDTPLAIGNIDDATDVSCGNAVCCARRSDRITCWGDPRVAARGDGYDRDGPEPVPMDLPTDVDLIALGQGHGLAQTSSGTVLVWGENDQRQLGLGDNVPRLVPVELASLSNVAQLDAYGDRSCARTSAGAVYCWGDGAPGDGTSADADVPTLVDASMMGAVTDIAVARDSTCAIDGSGAAWCWGRSTRCGDGTTGSDTCLTPVAVSGGLTFSTLEGGHAHVCGIASGTGHVWCWGSARLGDGTDSTDGSPTPVQIIDGSGAVGGVLQLGLGLGYTCMRRSADVLCVGESGDGQTGTGTTDLSMAAPVETAPGVMLGATTQLACGAAACMAQLADNTWVAWGDDQAVLGDGDTADNTRALVAAHGFAATRILVTSSSACAEVASEWQCWGRRSSGEYEVRARPLLSDVVFP